MSLLADLLSKIKHTQPSRGSIPPTLRNSISEVKKSSFKRRILLLSGISILALASGFATVYILMQKTGKPNGIQASVPKVQVQAPKVAAVSPKAPPASQTPEPAKQEPAIIAQKPAEKNQKPKTPVIKKTKLSISKRKDKGPSDNNSVKIVQKNNSDNNKNITTDKSEAPVIEKKATTSSDKDFYLYMANAYEQKRDYPKAVESYKKVLTAEPGNYMVLNNIASIFILSASFEEAKAYSQMAVNLRNDYVPALINMGIALAGLKDASAENYLQHALKFEPDNTYAILNLALLYEKKGDYSKAREYYFRLQRLGDARGSLGLERIKSGSRLN